MMLLHLLVFHREVLLVRLWVVVMMVLMALITNIINFVVLGPPAAAAAFLVLLVLFFCLPGLLKTKKQRKIWKKNRL